MARLGSVVKENMDIKRQVVMLGGTRSYSLNKGGKYAALLLCIYLERKWFYVK